MARRLRCLVRILLALGLPAVWTAAGGQGVAGERSTPQGLDVETVHETVRLVLLPTTVTNRRGKPVTGLAPADFRLLEDGVPQQIGVFATEQDLPISLAFVLDVSGSMGLDGKLGRARAAIRTFVEALDPGDRAGLICFADDQVTWVTEFTSDRERFLERLQVQEAGGKTALYDALAASPRLVSEKIEGRKAIVFFTDGLDNASELTTLNAVWLARRVAVPIHTVAFVSMQREFVPRRVRQSLGVLDRFSSETGGELHPIHEQADLARAVTLVQSELRFQYVIGYYPSDQDWNGAFRLVTLGTGQVGLTVRTRRGYYAQP